MTIHYAHLKTSPRLQRVLAALMENRILGLTTREIIEAANVCAVNSAICELKRNGFQIDCRFERRTAGGESVFRYRLLGEE